MTDKISDDLALALIAKGFPADRTIYADGRIRIHSYITIADLQGLKYRFENFMNNAFDRKLSK